MSSRASQGSSQLVLDLRGSGCATVLMQLAASAKATCEATTLTVITDDRGAPEELPAWCRMTGHRFVGGMVGMPDHYTVILHPDLLNETTETQP